MPVASLEYQVDRELTTDEVSTLNVRYLKNPPKDRFLIKRITALHHHAARLLATGMPPVQVSATVGVTPAALAMWRHSEAFKELLDFYMEAEVMAWSNARERMILLGLDAAAELHRRLESNPEEFPIKALVEVMVAALDRGGHAPLQRREVLHGLLTPDEVAKMKAAVQGDRVMSRIVSFDEADTGSSTLSLPEPAGELN